MNPSNGSARTFKLADDHLIACFCLQTFTLEQKQRKHLFICLFVFAFNGHPFKFFASCIDDLLSNYTGCTFEFKLINFIVDHFQFSK